MLPISTFTSSHHLIPFGSPDIRPTTSSSTATDVDDWAAFFIMPSTPPVISTPDDIFSGPWNTPLEIPDTAPIMAHNSSSSSPTDFAFEPPADNKTPSTGFSYTPSTGNSYGLPLSGYSSASSFSSSASGSYGSNSFSSADALPAISRDFSRPSVQQAKRPATAGGLLQSRSPFGGHVNEDKKGIPEEPSFVNPFSSSAFPSHTEAFDPRQPNRRASEGQGSNMPPPSWPAPANPSLASAPPTQASFDSYPQPQQARSAYIGHANRPQTSDGLPSFGGPTPLPSARSVVGSFSSLTSQTALQPPAQIRSSYEDSTHPFRDRSNSDAQPPSTSRSEGELTFVPIGGPVPKKRPRRRFDEIERLYKCGWSGCEKSYGTLNHLNAHVAMQSHGEKRLPSEFKDMRKAWRKKKREVTAANANGQFNAYARGSVSSESSYDRRESTISNMSSASAARFPPGAVSTAYKYDSRPTTGSSVASSSDGRSHHPQSGVPPFGYGQAMQTMPAPTSSLQARRDSAPQHVSMPYQPAPVGFRQNDDGVTPTPQNPFPFNFSMNMSVNPNVPPEHQQYIQQQQQHQQQQHLHQPPPGHHAYQQHQQQQQHHHQSMRPGTGGFPFQTLTQPMPMVNGPQYGQFAFR